MAQNCQVDATNSPSRENSPAEATPTSINMIVDIPVARSSRSPGASKHPPGLRLTSSGKWGVQIRHPIKRARIWLGSYTTVEEATNIYNKKKLEYASLCSELCEEDASFREDESKPGLTTSTDASLRVVESRSTIGRPNCIVLALSAEETKNTRRKSGCFSVQNRQEKLSMSKKCPHEISSSSKENDLALASPTSVNVAADITVAKKSRSLGAEKHPGLSITTSGKYGVQIRHPITRSRIWLGSFSTIEEAKNMYNTKNLEYASLYPTVINHKKHSVLKAKAKLKGKAKRKGKHKQQRLVIEGITVWETRSGKWGVSIYHPVSKLKIWLGSHGTPQEAVESYHRKKLEFDPSYDRGSHATPPARYVTDTFIPARDVASKAANANITVPVKLIGTDKWRVTVKHPLLKHSLLLGSYDTAEEAEEVYNRKKLELDAVLHSDRIKCPKADVASAADLASEGMHVKKYKGVRPCDSGRWMSQIQSPISKKNKVYLGTFKTAEEAAEAFNRTRREFDAIVSLVKKCKHEAEYKSKKPVILEQDGISVDESARLFQIVVESHSYNPNGNDNQMVEVSAAEQEFGMGIVDSYGRLVGEYSRLDDELWLSRPGDDLEFDVNGTFFNGNGELAWDPYPKRPHYFNW